VYARGLLSGDVNGVGKMAASVSKDAENRLQIFQ
jgi:hypothetical protein